MDPALIFVLVLVIGIAAGLIAHRMFRPSWFARQIAGGRAALTSALVGIAGAFVGFHLLALVVPTIGTGVVLIGAVVGAAVFLWGWRSIKL